MHHEAEKSPIPLFFLLFLLSLALCLKGVLRLVNRDTTKSEMNCAASPREGTKCQEGYRGMCVCVCVCVGKHTLSKHLWGGRKHWSEQWGFYYEFVCGEITQELLLGIILGMSGSIKIQRKNYKSFSLYFSSFFIYMSVCLGSQWTVFHASLNLFVFTPIFL